METMLKLRANLENTIAGKRTLIRRLRHSQGIAADTSAEFLQLNVDELVRILAEVDLAIAELRSASGALKE